MAPQVILFLTRGMSLQAWERCGLLSREMALYLRLQKSGVKVAIVTYGNAGDLGYASQYPGITICCNRWGLPQRFYEWLLPWLHRDVLKKASLIKTNQTNGAEVALRAARRYHKPLIARCGYMWSKNLLCELGPEAPALKRALQIESQVFAAADALVVTSDEMEQNLLARFPDSRERLRLIPNYVDTELFRLFLKPSPSGSVRLIFVGRLAPEKNLGALIEAVRELKVKLDIIGQGPCRESLQAQAADMPQVRFRGVLPHEQLPALLAASDIFVFPSLYEGHPKTPIEAMACGLPIIGSDVPGIRELIDHGRTGLLCCSDSKSLRQAIVSLLDDSERRLRMGRAARESVVERFSLEHIVDLELKLYRSLVKDFE